MGFCFRYRIKALTPPDLAGSPETVIHLAGHPPITITTADAHPFGTWVIFRAWGYETHEAAINAGRAFGDALLLTGALRKHGFDLGLDRSTLQFSRDVHRAVQRAAGRELRTEVHGLMVYRKDTVQIFGLDAHGSSRVSTEALKESLQKWQACSDKLTDRQRTCAALINDSFFVMNTDGQFVLRISAVEALCEQGNVEEEHEAALRKLKAFADTTDMGDSVRTAINNMLSSARRQSVGSAYRAKFNALLSSTEAKAFAKLYNLRSSLLHEGKGRGELQGASNEALDLAASLLEADLA